MFLSPTIIIKGYNKGIFPMADSLNDPFVFWVEPKERGIIKIEEFKINRSLKKELKKQKCTIKVNENFEKIIKLCAKNSNRKSTWINNQIIESYIQLFKIGIAKSIECFENDKLIGGLYGIIVGKIFCGESMFSLKKNSSKIALAYLAAYLKEGGFKYIDTQFYSEHLKQFGTKKIKKEKYLNILSRYGKNNADFPKKIKKNVLEYFK
jgi:leucyl/phenylalanyl-tRNA--protein transferase|tara:strand:+ start:569 stop:1192 length:624 start_codon:yes stop_codon:yes gene_type:complete